MLTLKAMFPVQNIRRCSCALGEPLLAKVVVGRQPLQQGTDLRRLRVPSFHSEACGFMTPALRVLRPQGPSLNPTDEHERLQADRLDGLTICNAERTQPEEVESW